MSRNGLDAGFHKDDPAAPHNKPIRAKARKDTRRWCKGKEGVEHVLEAIPDPSRPRPCRWYDFLDGSATYLCHHVVACLACGKKVDFFWLDRNKECPDYTPPPQ